MLIVCLAYVYQSLSIGQVDKNNYTYNIKKRMDCSDYLKLIKQKTPRAEKVSWNENSELCMVFVEFRKLDIIPTNLYNIANIYGNSNTSIIIIHSKLNKELITDTVKDWTGVRLVQLTQNESSIDEYNRILTSVGFWKLFEKHKFVLINQWDSYLFRKIPQKFFNYDYVGGPTSYIYVLRNNSIKHVCADDCEWCSGKCKRVQSTFDYHPNDIVYSCMNGGLSLRKVSAMIDLCSKKPFKGEPEDIYFCFSYLYRPSVHEALEFVEHLPYDGIPVSCHKIWAKHNLTDYAIQLFNKL